MWVLDGSPELSAQGNTLECKGSDTGSVYNGMWKDNADGLKSGVKYWKVSCDQVSSCLFVGITDPSRFKKGWGFKGLMYGGNLSNGGALLEGNFGPVLKSKDVVGILVNLEGNTIKVYVDINGSSLGLAFDVPKSVLGGIFPAVHFSGGGKVSIEQSTVLPSLIRLETSDEGMDGNWTYSLGNSSATLKLKTQSPDSIQGSLKVVNRIQCTFTRQSDGGVWTGSTGASTMMGGPPEAMQLEHDLAQLIGGSLLLQLNKGDKELTLKNQTSGKTSVWLRFNPPAPTTVTANPFN